MTNNKLTDEHGTKFDFQALREAAEKATPGPWRAFRYDSGICGVGGGESFEILVCERISSNRPEDAKFIAVAHPAAVLALLDELAAKDAELNELQERRKADSAAPVAWRYRHHNGLAPSIWKYVDSESECNAAPNYQRQPLYTTPQPPAVVQEELLSAMEEVLHISDRDHEAWHRARNGISACLAAMLQVSSDEIGSWSNGNNTPKSTAITPAEPDKKLTDDVLDEIIAVAKTSMEQYLALSLKAERSAVLSGNSPVVQLPTEFYSENGIVVQIEKVMAALALHGIEYKRNLQAPRVSLRDAVSSIKSSGIEVDAGNILAELDDEHVRYESNAGGNLWIQCSKQKFERMKLAGMITRVLYERPQNAQQNIPKNIPDGWVMVPVEPTDKQWAAGMQAFANGMDKVSRVYKAMLAAAPQQEDL